MHVTMQYDSRLVGSCVKGNCRGGAVGGRVVPGNQLTLANSDLASVGTPQDIAVESRHAAQ